MGKETAETNPPVGVSIVDTGKKDNRELLNRVLSLYSRFGLRSVTMDDISRELGVSKKTLYQLVEDRKELIRLVVMHELELHREVLAELERENRNAIDQLVHIHTLVHRQRSRHSPTFYYDLKKYYPELYREWIDTKSSSIYEVIRKNLESGQRMKLFRQEMDPHVIARLHMALAETLAGSRIMGDDETESGHFMHEVFIYHLHGICNVEGLDYIKRKHRHLWKE